jgi:hypothetical protein
MIRITAEVIEKVNKLCPEDWDDDSQGIWKEAYGVPNKEKRHCLVMRYSPRGAHGGNCWNENDLTDYTNEEPDFIVLDKLLEVLNLDIPISKYNEILSYKREQDGESQMEYYGNYSEWEIHYIPLEDVLKVIGLKALLEQL